MPKRAIAALVVFAAAFAAWCVAPFFDNAVHVTIFDIGQGDAILVRHGGEQLLIDGGPGSGVLGRLGAVMPFWDRHIETVVLTHPHADHYRGLADVFARYDVARVFVSGAENDDDGFAQFARALATETSDVVVARAGDVIAVGTDAKLRVLWPDAADTGDDLNDASVVAMLEAHGRKVLLMGDATTRVEDALLAAGVNVDADVLKVGHHGSKYSSSPAFLSAVSPALAAISLGKNGYGHPAKATLARLQKVGASIWRTDTGGSVDIIISQQGARVCTPSFWCTFFGGTRLNTD